MILAIACGASFPHQISPDPSGGDRKFFTHPEVAKATGLSTGLLSALRSGKNLNPTKDTLEKLGKFFWVSAAYFLDDGSAEQVGGQRVVSQLAIPDSRASVADNRGRLTRW